MTWPQIRAFLKAIAPPQARRQYRKLEKRLLNARWRLGRQIRTCSVAGIDIRIGVSSEMERFRCSTYAVKEPETIEWLAGSVRPEDVVFDIGANIGLYSLFAAKLNPLCTVYAFEPESQNYARLCNNIVLNRLENIIPCNAPIADREMLDYFLVGSLEAGSALHSFGKPLAASWPVLRQAAISVSLDRLVGAYNLPQPNLIKLDVDGIEDQILAGADEVLRSPALRSILIEINNDGDNGKRADIIARLQSAGLRIAVKSAWINEQHGVTSQNFIFIRGDVEGER